MNKILFIIWVVVAVALLLFISPRLTGYIASQLPAGAEIAGSESLGVSLAGFLGNYSQSHGQAGTAFKDTAYSCLLLSDALEAEGFTAGIAIRDTVGTAGSGTFFDDAWILVSGDNESLAVDGLTYSIIYSNQNPLYYSGLVFSGAEEFREYADLYEEYAEYKQRTESTRAALNKCTTLVVNMSIEYDRNHGGRWATAEAIDDHSLVFQKLGECRAFSGMLESEMRHLDYLEQSISNTIMSTTEPFG